MCSEFEKLLKYTPAIVALVGGLLTLISFIFQRFIQLISTDEISKLFLDKAKQANLKLWHFLIGVVYSMFVFVLIGSTFNYLFNKVDITKDEFPRSVLIWSTGFFLISLLIIALMPLLINKLEKSKIITIMTCNGIFGLIVYSFAFNKMTYVKFDLTNLTLLLLLPIILTTLYFFIISKINANKPKDEYLISSVSEGKIKLENLRHGFVIDEKRTVYFPKDSTDKDIFYLCDFTSKIYLKYQKIQGSKNEDENS
ncbi:hypothetical protein [Bacillus cereus group sp. N21]|uniref:hypothetical protein n=1 Tax=Bacillus cereus group sp. N21 TaxID=2794591 RepID=UPI0018F38CFE|nr:hypothetical protein [Bacillus cereus group sp. N21]MBJ8026606.1 hypothetical protein [Bacillus cereus group sp. N21]